MEPYDIKLGIARDVWASLPQQAQEMAATAAQMRAQLAGVRMLADLHTPARFVAAIAEKNGVTVLRKADDGTVALGVFDVPALSSKVVGDPKGECCQSSMDCTP